MELPVDIQRKIALELEPYDLVSFCSVNKDTNKEICNSDIFWRLKIERDFPEIFRYFQLNKLVLRNPKTTYMRNFLELSEYIDHQIDIIENKYDKALRKYLDTKVFLYSDNRGADNAISWEDSDQLAKIWGVEFKNKVYKIIYDTLRDYRKLHNYSTSKYTTGRYHLDENNRVLIKDMVKRNMEKHNLYELYRNIPRHILHEIEDLFPSITSNLIADSISGIDYPFIKKYPDYK